MPIAKLATTPEEVAAALRLRYEVFYVEGGDARYADHERRVWTDRDDGPQSHLIIAVDDANTVIGTARVTVLRDWEFIGHDAYGFDFLAKHLGVTIEALWPRLARLDRGAVDNRLRGTGISALLQNVVEGVALENHCDLLVGILKVGNLRGIRAYSKLGFTVLPHVRTHAGFAGHLVFKLLFSATVSESCSDCSSSG